MNRYLSEVSGSSRSFDNATLNAQISELRKNSGGRGGPKSALRDMKKLYPSNFNPANDVFSTWAEVFLCWIWAEREPLATALEKAALAEDEVPMEEGHHKEDVRFAWLHLKKLMGDEESIDIVRTTAKDNSLQSFRLLHRRYAPKMSAVKSGKLRAITNLAEKHANS